MSTDRAPASLESAFAGVADNYRGADVDLHALYRGMRRDTPVIEGNFMGKLGVPNIAGHDVNRRTFTVFGYRDTMAVLRDAANYTSGFIAEGLGAFFDGLILTGMDGEEHRRARALLQPIFMPEVVNRWRPKMDSIVRNEYLLPIQAQHKADLMDFALHFPIRLIYALIGFPDDEPEQVEQYATWALAILAGPQVDPEKAAQARGAAMAAAQSLYDAIKIAVVRRRAEGFETGDDLISRLLRAEFEGQRLDDHQVTTFVRALLPAAGETTTRTFGSLMTLLLERPELLARVRADRTLVAKAIDEAVRFEPVATFKVRQAAKDVEIGGVQIPKGSMVQCIVSSANRDEEAFENSETFDIDRKPKPSFGFGFGPHMCIGQFIAKTELTVALNAVLDLLPNLRLDPDQPAPKITGAQLRGPHELHVLWD